VIAGREEFAANGKEDCVNSLNLSDECSCAWIAIPGKNFCSRKWERRMIVQRIRIYLINAHHVHVG